MLKLQIISALICIITLSPYSKVYATQSGSDEEKNLANLHQEQTPSDHAQTKTHQEINQMKDNSYISLIAAPNGA